jgi:hypothetical protein
LGGLTAKINTILRRREEREEQRQTRLQRNKYEEKITRMRR